MADHPARRGYGQPAEETGWGSPMPAEYGSLTAFLPPLDDEPGGAGAPEPRGDRPTGGRGWRGRRAARTAEPPPPAGNGAALVPPSDGAASGWAAAPVASPRPDAPAPRRNRSGPIPVPVDTPGAPAAAPEVAAAAGLAVPATRQRTRDQADPSRGRASSARRQRRDGIRPQWAQSRRTVRHLSVWSVAKVSIAFYFMLLVAIVVASVALWYVANAFGSIQSIEKSIRTLFDLSKFTIHPKQVAVYTALGGAILAVVGTLANILAALMYNLISDLVGGIRFDEVDEGR